MRADIAIAFAALAACGQSGSSSSDVERPWRPISTPGRVYIVDMVVDHDGHVVAKSADPPQLLHPDGDALVAFGPPIPAGTEQAPMQVGPDGTVCFYDQCLAPGASAWAPIGLPINENFTPYFAADGSRYAIDLDGRVMVRHAGAASWELADGTPYPGKHRNVYLGADLFMTVENGMPVFVTKYPAVDDDGTIFYSYIQYQPHYGKIIYLHSDGEETIRSNGWCVDGAILCPRGEGPLGIMSFQLGPVRRPNGGFYNMWGSQNGEYKNLMLLEPDARDWITSDLPAATPAVSAPMIVADGEDRVWDVWSGGFGPFTTTVYRRD